RLVLIGRSAFPERDEWEQWLADHNAEDKVSRRIRDLLEIEQVGGEFMVISADVVNQRQMKDAMTKACEQFGEVNGVIHTAGVAGGGMIQFKTSEIAEMVLAPK